MNADQIMTRSALTRVGFAFFNPRSSAQIRGYSA